jgi:hypothetical protein
LTGSMHTFAIGRIRILGALLPCENLQGLLCEKVNRLGRGYFDVQNCTTGSVPGFLPQVLRLLLHGREDQGAIHAEIFGILPVRDVIQGQYMK